MTATKEKQLGVIATGKTAFQVEKDELLDALLLCAKVVQRTSAIPLLSCIKFDLKGETLFITAMDISQAVLRMLKVTNDNGIDGSYLLPAREAIDLVRKLPAGEVSFTQNDSMVAISYGVRGRANLVAMKSEEYPELPKLSNAMFISVPIETMKKGALASRFTLTDEKTPTLTAIHIHNDNGKLAFMGTDRHRVYRHISDVAIEDQDRFRNAMIPALQFKGIVDSIKAHKVDVAVDTNHLVMRDKNTVYFGRLLDGNYPQISHIFAKMKEGTAIQVPRGEMDDTLNRMLSLDGVENNRITLEVDDKGELTVHSQSQTGDICEVFPGSKVDEGFPTIKFNARYLKDALLVGDRDVKSVSLRTTGIGFPGFIEFDGDDSVIVVVNQVR
ncbi:DNA polymerase III subunit beta [Paenibacillus alkaliterrae]|uniref:DNA polymerase III subunit beta n=1 Tax=Paenibacillus alkaliterrae TaxID=320909 RepID=UPI001F22083D|nr:DNA polymerase III subunit beta [Paenibacillus alkaliterrae]MCF2940663.1 DNA polymerase III subunit beta [Paenibacillus alkaliterrae]